MPKFERIHKSPNYLANQIDCFQENKSDKEKNIGKKYSYQDLLKIIDNPELFEVFKNENKKDYDDFLIVLREAKNTSKKLLKDIEQNSENLDLSKLDDLFVMPNELQIKSWENDLKQIVPKFSDVYDNREDKSFWKEKKSLNILKSSNKVPEHKLKTLDLIKGLKDEIKNLKAEDRKHFLYLIQKMGKGGIKIFIESDWESENVYSGGKFLFDKVGNFKSKILNLKSSKKETFIYAKLFEAGIYFEEPRFNQDKFEDIMVFEEVLKIVPDLVSHIGSGNHEALSFTFLGIYKYIVQNGVGEMPKMKKILKKSLFLKQKISEKYNFELGFDVIHLMTSHHGLDKILLDEILEVDVEDVLKIFEYLGCDEKNNLEPENKDIQDFSDNILTIREIISATKYIKSYKDFFESVSGDDRVFYQENWKSKRNFSALFFAPHKDKFEDNYEASDINENRQEGKKHSYVNDLSIQKSYSQAVLDLVPNMKNIFEDLNMDFISEKFMKKEIHKLIDLLMHVRIPNIGGNRSWYDARNNHLYTRDGFEVFDDFERRTDISVDFVYDKIHSLVFTIVDIFTFFEKNKNILDQFKEDFEIKNLNDLFLLYQKYQSKTAIRGKRRFYYEDDFFELSGLIKNIFGVEKIDISKNLNYYLLLKTNMFRDVKEALIKISKLVDKVGNKHLIDWKNAGGKKYLEFIYLSGQDRDNEESLFLVEQNIDSSEALNYFIHGADDNLSENSFDRKYFENIKDFIEVLERRADNIKNEFRPSVWRDFKNEKIKKLKVLKKNTKSKFREKFPEKDSLKDSKFDDFRKDLKEKGLIAGFYEAQGFPEKFIPQILKEVGVIDKEKLKKEIFEIFKPIKRKNKNSYSDEKKLRTLEMTTPQVKLFMTIFSGVDDVHFLNEFISQYSDDLTECELFGSEVYPIIKSCLNIDNRAQPWLNSKNIEKLSNFMGKNNYAYFESDFKYYKEGEVFLYFIWENNIQKNGITENNWSAVLFMFLNNFLPEGDQKKLIEMIYNKEDKSKFILKHYIDEHLPKPRNHTGNLEYTIGESLRNISHQKDFGQNLPTINDDQTHHYNNQRSNYDVVNLYNEKELLFLDFYLEGADFELFKSKIKKLIFDEIESWEGMNIKKNINKNLLLYIWGKRERLGVSEENLKKIIQYYRIDDFEYLSEIIEVDNSGESFSRDLTLKEKFMTKGFGDKLKRMLESSSWGYNFTEKWKLFRYYEFEEDGIDLNKDNYLDFLSNFLLNKENVYNFSALEERLKDAILKKTYEENKEKLEKILHKVLIPKILNQETLSFKEKEILKISDINNSISIDPSLKIILETVNLFYKKILQENFTSKSLVLIISDFFESDDFSGLEIFYTKIKVLINFDIKILQNFSEIYEILKEDEKIFLRQNFLDFLIRDFPGLDFVEKEKINLTEALKEFLQQGGNLQDYFSQKSLDFSGKTSKEFISTASGYLYPEENISFESHKAQILKTFGEILTFQDAGNFEKAGDVLKNLFLEFSDDDKINSEEKNKIFRFIIQKINFCPSGETCSHVLVKMIQYFEDNLDLGENNMRKLFLIVTMQRGGNSFELKSFIHSDSPYFTRLGFYNLGRHNILTSSLGYFLRGIPLSGKENRSIHPMLVFLKKLLKKDPDNFNANINMLGAFYGTEYQFKTSLADRFFILHKNFGKVPKNIWEESLLTESDEEMDQLLMKYKNLSEKIFENNKDLLSLFWSSESFFKKIDGWDGTYEGFLKSFVTLNHFENLKSRVSDEPEHPFKGILRYAENDEALRRLFEEFFIPHKLEGKSLVLEIFKEKGLEVIPEEVRNKNIELVNKHQIKFLKKKFGEDFVCKILKKFNILKRKNISYFRHHQISGAHVAFISRVKKLFIDFGYSELYNDSSIVSRKSGEYYKGMHSGMNYSDVFGEEFKQTCAIFANTSHYTHGIPTEGNWGSIPSLGAATRADPDKMKDVKNYNPIALKLDPREHVKTPKGEILLDDNLRDLMGEIIDEMIRSANMEIKKAKSW